MNNQTLPVTVSGVALCFGSGVRVTCQRTLRIPDDGRNHPLPPGLGVFPLRRIEDHASRVPAEWAARGGVILPMYQREALWICLHGLPWFALYDEHLDTLAPGQALTAVKSIKDIDADKSTLPLQDDAPVGPVPIKVLPLGNAVRDGDW